MMIAVKEDSTAERKLPLLPSKKVGKSNLTWAFLCGLHVCLMTAMHVQRQVCYVN